ncbi:uncharacterized protein G2W53_022472 [Senna tora]|uniref:Uncharacterized protein n=1 Tax=Senna tora TaxID=362788 RepID=A0A834WKI8_9FABA|nr:uncharacterized protein G2W53_022472 [Senna tora]
MTLLDWLKLKFDLELTVFDIFGIRKFPKFRFDL